MVKYHTIVIKGTSDVFPGDIRQYIYYLRNEDNMTCKQCGGIMTVDKQRELFVCPFCGAIEPFDSMTKEELQKMLNEALYDVRKDTRQIKETLKDTQTDSSIKYALSLVALSIACLVFLIFTAYGFDTGSYMVGVVSAIQLLCAILAIIFKVSAKSKGKPKLSIVSTILIGIILSLVIVWFIALAVDTPSSDRRNDEEKTWPTIGMGSDLPVPDLKLKEVYNTDKYFHARLEDTDKAGFEAYVNECKKAGYNIDPFYKDYHYIAYDKNDNELELNFFYGSEISITMNKAITFTEFYWPKSGGLQDVPAPEADQIYVESISESSARLHVGMITKDYFMKYIDELKEAGFSGGYDDKENQYRGEKDNVNLRITLKRDKILYYDVFVLDRK